MFDSRSFLIDLELEILSRNTHSSSMRYEEIKREGKRDDGERRTLATMSR